jgi:hypothetical protein
MDAKTEPTDDEALVNFEFPPLISHLPALEVVQHELQLFADIVPFLRHLSFSANLSPNWILGFYFYYQKEKPKIVWPCSLAQL